MEASKCGERVVLTIPSRPNRSALRIEDPGRLLRDRFLEYVERAVSHPVIQYPAVPTLAEVILLPPQLRRFKIKAHVDRLLDKLRAELRDSSFLRDARVVIAHPSRRSQEGPRKETKWRTCSLVFRSAYD